MIRPRSRPFSFAFPEGWREGPAAMRWTLGILTGMGAMVFAAGAQEIVVRRAVPVTTVERRADGFEFVLPAPAVARTLAGPTLTRTTGQDFVASYRVDPDLPWVVRLSGGGKVEDAFSNGRTAGAAQFVGARQRTALVAQWNDSNSLEAALESQARWDQTSRAETSLRTEVVLRTGIVPGLSSTVTLGRAALQAFDEVRRSRTYLTLTAEQKLPWAPVRLTLAPAVAQEAVVGVEDSATLLLGGGGGVFWDLGPHTTLGATLTQIDQAGPLGGVAGTLRTYAGSVEQRLEAGRAVKLSGGYEELTNGGALSTSAVFVGIDSTFPVTETLTGALQFRQRLVDSLPSNPGPEQETVLAVTVGGDF